MKAHLIERLAPIGEGTLPLRLADIADPVPGIGEVLVRVSACGVCHTELDEIEGRTPPPMLPMVPGHQVVGRLASGDRVGVAWIFSACGRCVHCLSGEENLCAQFVATGRDRFGGYAELMTAPSGFVHPIPDVIDDEAAAPLLCAGAIGFRSLRLCQLKSGQRLGLTGFGASAHLVLQMARHQHPDVEVFVFARSEDQRAFARCLGADWAGDTGDAPPALLDAIIDTTPAWWPVVRALECLTPGGRLVVNAIRKEAGDQDQLEGLDYARHLWMEKEIKSVANVARADVRGCLELAASAGIRAETSAYPFEDANRALVDLKMGRGVGAKVLMAPRN